MNRAGDTEAIVTIDGATLTDPQVAALRVAVGSFRSKVTDPEYAKALGPIAELYAARMAELETFLVACANREDRLARAREMGLRRSP